MRWYFHPNWFVEHADQLDTLTAETFRHCTDGWATDVVVDDMIAHHAWCARRGDSWHIFTKQNTPADTWDHHGSHPDIDEAKRIAEVLLKIYY